MHKRKEAYCERGQWELYLEISFVVCVGKSLCHAIVPEANNRQLFDKERSEQCDGKKDDEKDWSK